MSSNLEQIVFDYLTCAYYHRSRLDWTNSGLCVTPWVLAWSISCSCPFMPIHCPLQDHHLSISLSTVPQTGHRKSKKQDECTSAGEDFSEVSNSQQWWWVSQDQWLFPVVSPHGKHEKYAMVGYFSLFTATWIWLMIFQALKVAQIKVNKLQEDVQSLRLKILNYKHMPNLGNGWVPTVF